MCSSCCCGSSNGRSASCPRSSGACSSAHEIEGRSFKQMAAETGTNVNTLLSRKRYAVLHLRERLQRAFDELTRARGTLNHGEGQRTTMRMQAIGQEISQTIAKKIAIGIALFIGFLVFIVVGGIRRAAAVELAAARHLRPASRHVLGSARPAGVVPDPVRRIRPRRFPRRPPSRPPGMVAEGRFGSIGVWVYTERTTIVTHTNSSTPLTTMRLWPGILFAGLILPVRLLVPIVWPDGLVFAVIGAVVCGLAVMLWWPLVSRAPRAERWGGLALMIAALAATWALAHPSISTGAMGMLVPLLAVPVLGFAFGSWAWASRRFVRRSAARVDGGDHRPRMRRVDRLCAPTA